MLRKTAALALVLILAVPAALAETWSGSVSAVNSTPVTAPADGVLTAFSLTAGGSVRAEETVGQIRPEAVYATEGGVVSIVKYAAGDIASGTVLQVTPVSPYLVKCSVADAYPSPATSLVHVGETVRIRCTADRTHLAAGVVTALNGSEYDVTTTAGELYVGEAVNVYRGDTYAYETKIGEGTVLESSDAVYTCQGTLLDVRVKAGDRVERGQLLFIWASSDCVTVTSPVSGIVTEVAAKPGDSVREDQVLASVAEAEDVRVVFTVPEDRLPGLAVGGTMWYLRADDPEDIPRPAVITNVDGTVASGEARVTLRAEEALPIGLTVVVSDEAEP